MNGSSSNNAIAGPSNTTNAGSEVMEVDGAGANPTLAPVSQGGNSQMERGPRLPAELSAVLSSREFRTRIVGVVHEASTNLINQRVDGKLTEIVRTQVLSQVQQQSQSLPPNYQLLLDRAVDQRMQTLSNTLQPQLDILQRFIRGEEGNLGGDDDVDLADEDEDMENAETGSSDGSSPPSSPSRNSKGVALAGALREYLRKQKVMCKEANKLPVMNTMPSCAAGIDVEAYINNIHPGPKLDQGSSQVLYYWKESLRENQWNRTATTVLAEDYLASLKGGKVKYRGAIVPFDKAVTVELLQKIIPIRLDNTRKHWLEIEKMRCAQEDVTSPSDKALSEAEEKKRSLRRNNRANRLLKKRLKYVGHYYEGRTIQKPTMSLLDRLGSKGMNAPISEDENDEYHVPVRHLWISPDISNLLEEIDRQCDLSKARLMKSQPIRKKGNKSTPVRGTCREILESVATPRLPRNWYNPQWLSRRKQYERVDLKMQAEEALPMLAELQSVYNEMSA